MNAFGSDYSELVELAKHRTVEESETDDFTVTNYIGIEECLGQNLTWGAIAGAFNQEWLCKYGFSSEQKREQALDVLENEIAGYDYPICIVDNHCSVVVDPYIHGGYVHLVDESLLDANDAIYDTNKRPSIETINLYDRSMKL